MVAGPICIKSLKALRAEYRHSGLDIVMQMHYILIECGR